MAEYLGYFTESGRSIFMPSSEGFLEWVLKGVNMIAPFL